VVAKVTIADLRLPDSAEKLQGDPVSDELVMRQ
jgi:hypothetical protein